jgi:hypothetical protein
VCAKRNSCASDFVAPCGVICVLLVFIGAEHWRLLLAQYPSLRPWAGYFDQLFVAAETQWIGMLHLSLLLCVCFCCRSRHDIAIRYAKHRFWGRLSSGDGALAVFVVVALHSYIWEYSEASRSPDVVSLISCLVFAQAVHCWLSYESVHPLTRPHKGFFIVLLILLMVTCFSQPRCIYAFAYRDQIRWSGIWINPNTFGLLMGMGVTIAFGSLCKAIFKATLPLTRVETCGDFQSAPSVRLRDSGRMNVVLATSAILCLGIGLVKSYSRGAWLGTGLAIVYLAAQVWRKRVATHPHEDGRDACDTSRWSPPSAVGAVRPQIALPLAILAISLFTILFFAFRHSEQPLLRRALSIGNVSDFSWRNRAATYAGALQLMASKPWFGFGWNQPPEQYERFYQPALLSEGSAIGLNNYFLLGMTLGIPALLCFLAYIWLAFCPPRAGPHRSTLNSGGSQLASNIQQSETTDHGLLTTDLEWLKTTCRAGVIVLLVGFWFDGGLFKLALAAPFWILLELGRAEPGGDFNRKERKGELREARGS